MNEEERRKIDQIDSAMAQLFVQRMAAVRSVAANKKAAGAPVEDLERERAMLERRCAELEDASLRGYYSDFLRSVISISKDYQTELISGSIIIERGCLSRAGQLLGLKSGKALVVSDSGVPGQYPRTVAESLAGCGVEASVFTFEQGEANKNLTTYAAVMNALVERGFTRTDAVVAVGGGVVGDMAGFVAATFMRGIRFFNIPTTLLSQVDSSVGGKTAVDFGGVKNIVGAFHMPSKVLIDPDTLATLPQRQLANGLVEAIKMGATGDAELFELIERSSDAAADADEIIRRSIAFKKSVVDADPRESGLRRVLNFGHTIGHAIESVGAGRYLHGEAVALGMLPFAGPEVRGRLEAVLGKYNLPVSHSLPAAEIRALIAHDKKASGAGITVVKVDKIGTFRFETVDIEQLAL
ncbi:MAG: 3-dehydroquinate synthase [Bacteroidales bacterium]|nr:3-dehydroquinate synthase [Bacteroidales bacterium]